MQASHPRSVRSTLKRSHCAEILSLTASLDSLTLQPSGRRSYTFDSKQRLCDYIDFFPGSTIRKLQLTNVEFHENDFVELIARHSATLNSITLVACELFTCSLKRFCKKVRACSKLEEFCSLYSIYGASSMVSSNEKSSGFVPETFRIRNSSYNQLFVRK